MSYYVVDNLPLVLEFSVTSSAVEMPLNINLVESSFDLITNPQFTMAKRRDWMIPTPFVLTDAVIIKQKVKPSEKLEIEVGKLPPKNYRYTYSKDSLKAVTDSLR